jgi:hypothetical protein
MYFDFHRPQTGAPGSTAVELLYSSSHVPSYEERIIAALNHSGPEARVAVVQKLLDQSPIATCTLRPY